MPRALRSYDGDAVLHVVNRGNDRRRLFASEHDYAVFVGLMSWAQTRAGLRLLAYVLMPNHWHLVAWPTSPAQLSKFMHDVTGAHAALVRTESGTRGTGHIYQDRYHAVMLDSDVRSTTARCVTSRRTRFERGWWAAPSSGAGPACASARTAGA